jgi:hypothetical protein
MVSIDTEGKNAAVDSLRYKSCQPTLVFSEDCDNESLLSGASDTSLEPCDISERSRLGGMVLAAIHTLPPCRREILILV